MFSSDRDLLVYEPGLFGEVGWASQRLVAGTGSISGTTLTMSSQDNGFDEAGATSGHVVVVDDRPCEVVSRTSASVLEVSQLRVDPEDPAIPPPPATAAAVRLTTFAPQMGLAHRQLLTMLGIGEAGSDAEVTEGMIVNQAELGRAETLGALFLVLTGASAVSGPFGVLGRRAELYRRRFEAVRRRLAVLLDTDGDGEVDATRRLNALRLERA